MSNEFTPTAPLQTAVLFLVFNRPDTTAQVFEAIRQATLLRLYVVADCPPRALTWTIPREPPPQKNSHLKKSMFNLGIEAISAALIDITYVSDRLGNDQRYAIDASKIQKYLGWVLAETFETGLRKTVEWYLKNATWCQHVQDGSYQRQRLDVIENEKGAAA